MDLLELAVEIAVEGHKEQKDRYGEPYILHPMRVMMKMNTREEKIAAVLHDIIENTKMTLEDLRKRGFPENIVTAIDCLSKREGEQYEAYIERTRSNPLALRVKIADLEDNMDLRRIKQMTLKDVDRLSRYRKYWEELINDLTPNPSPKERGTKSNPGA
jgi:(p)ppGpp synthase/HD superfamily hydrolase